MIGNYKKIRFKKRLRKLHLIIFALLKNTVVLTCIAGFIAVSVPLFSAYEAHIINVTARIENDEKKRCDALSIGYWQNHEGCPEESDWTVKIQELSDGLSEAFSDILGEEICFYLAPSNCGPGGTIDGKLCRAKGKALANLSNIVSNHLDLNALIAGADDGDKAFDDLGLSSSSTVEEALTVIESIIIDTDATKKELTDAAYVAERIYTFYEEENPNPPWCIYPETGGSAASDLLSSPSVFDVMIVEPPVKEEPPAEDPPVEEEPITEPPVEEVPPEEPQEEEPPAEEEPQEETPVDEPVEEEPQEEIPEEPVSEDPPAEEEPAEEEPPTEDPLTEDPPVEDPPTEDPDPEDPPVEDPPAEEPDPEDPPVEDPPVEEPAE
ncbi:hypothetical protein KAT63_05050 [Candidatus Parcubacteria bacterium]|nr:hypothetical protein [Candidatus Parcubacteria bacterium]